MWVWYGVLENLFDILAHINCLNYFIWFNKINVLIDDPIKKKSKV